MTGDQNRQQFFAICAGAVVDNRKGLYTRHRKGLKALQHLVLAQGKLRESLFDRDYVVIQMRKTNRVPAQAFRECGDVLSWPLL